MDLDRDLAETEGAGDLLIHQARRDQRHDLVFATGQPFDRLAPGPIRLVALAVVFVAPEGCSHGIQHVLIAKRLGKEVDGTRLHGAHRHGYVAMPRHEDDRDADIRLLELGLEIQSAYAGQPDIEHQAARPLGSLVLKEFGGGSEKLDLQVDRAEQAVQRLAYRGIVVDDEDPAHAVFSAWDGRAMRKVAPGPSLDVAHIRPPCASTIERQIERPMPMPPSRVVKKGVNSRAEAAGSRPMPESRTTTSACPASTLEPTRS